ncbi:response regulator [Candidatus Saccharibacteria bacterium]|nr:sigma-54-dependent Fis family transcriptional regulator [Candidatus Saccharibacteria bacterium]NIV72303.1 response regulator [Calditrichia bacterium]NIV98769.1 response regulator [Candidatus Saccharibacteria bacterium]NIW79593.1 response regulator [Calditrichia bacterium]
MKSAQLMIVEDNDTMRLGMVESLRRAGYEVFEFANAQKGLNFFRRQPVPLVVADLKMEPMDGIELLQALKEIQPETEVLMVSAYGTVEVAVKAMQLGAADFLTKPFSADELRVRVKKVWEKAQQSKTLDQLLEQNRLLQEEFFEDMIGHSTPMQQLFGLLQRVAKEDSTILIEGESGTGKELVARAIHRQSSRAAKPFIKVNCGALNDNLLESELFGHEKGAFTGAVRRKKGRFELADGGTLFLDEIGDISPAMQVNLLRVLQEGDFERVGGEETISVDVRVICATHRNLKSMVMKGDFREDLYYRLSVIPMKLPPLRERKEDIPALVDHFLHKRQGAQPAKKISDAGIKLLLQYSWPGNIRELENLIERLQVISPGPEIEPQLISAHLGGGTFSAASDYQNLPLEEAVNAFERNLILHAMKKADGVKNQAAKLLGIRTSTLYYKLEKYGLL